MEPPNRLEKSIRFGCGFLFGCVLTVGRLLSSVWSGQYIASLVLTAGLVAGYAAMKLGDRFWENILRWWWPRLAPQSSVASIHSPICNLC